MEKTITDQKEKLSLYRSVNSGVCTEAIDIKSGMSFRSKSEIKKNLI